MATPTTQPKTQLQVYYKPQVGQPGYDANNPQAIYDSTGKLISLDQYKQATGQTAKPDNEIDWSAVQSASPPSPDESNATSNFNPNLLPGLGPIWGQLSDRDKAFVQSSFGIVSGQYGAGGIANADTNTWNDALQKLSTDPSIQATYGDAAKEGAQQLGVELGQITGNYSAQQASEQAQMLQQKKDLDTQIAQAGQAYSGFGEQAKQQLGATQNQIIQSTRSQYASQLQNLGSQYESKFGSAALAQQPTLTAGTGTSQVGYTPVGNVIGTNTQNQTQAEATLAAQQGSLPSVTSTGALSNSGSK